MLAGQGGEADDGVLIDADQPGGLADAAALGEVVQHGQEFVLGELAAEQGGAGAFAEAVPAGAAGEHAPLRVWAVGEGHAEVVPAAFAVAGAVGVGAAEAGEVVHGEETRKAGTEA